MISNKEAEKVRQFLEHIHLSQATVKVSDGRDWFVAKLADGQMNNNGLFMTFSNGVPVNYHPSQVDSVVFSDNSLTLSGTNGARSVNITIV